MKKKDEVRFDRMVPPQVIKRREACNLAYLPVGSLEWHGPHMPFGTDYMTVAYIAEQAARRFGGVAFPPMYYGDLRYYLQESRPEWRRTYARDMRVPKAYGATFGLEYALQRDKLKPPRDDGKRARQPIGLRVEEGERFFVELIARTLLEIHLYGFRNIIILPGHGPNPPFCRAAEDLYRQNALRKKAFGRPARTRSWFYIDPIKRSEPRFGKHWLHADKWEGAFTMIASPGTVHPEFLPKNRKTLVPAFLGEPYLNETRGYNPEMKDVWESLDYFDPRNGMTEAYGRKQSEAIIKVLGEVVRDFMRPARRRR